MIVDPNHFVFVLLLWYKLLFVVIFLYEAYIFLGKKVVQYTNDVNCAFELPAQS